MEEHLVEKRYIHHPGRRDWRPIWRWEDRALRRLIGLPVPQSLGWHREQTPDGPAYILRKTYLEGTPLGRITEQEARELGQLMASMHERRVVHNDPSPTNFIRTRDGRLGCIDFGRSRCFSWAHSLFFWYVGKELARLYWNLLSHAPELWCLFLQSYHAHSDNLSHHRFLIGGSHRFWIWRWRHRKDRIQPTIQPDCWPSQLGSSPR